MKRATMASARQAQQQQTLARAWVPNSCPPMSQRLGGVLDLARGSAATLQTLLGLENTMLRLSIRVVICMAAVGLQQCTP